MPRKLRKIRPNNPYHITQRGNYSLPIFDNSFDKDIYLTLFEEYRLMFQIKLLAYCIMDNHVHFILEPGDEIGLSSLFKRLNQRYSIYYNSKHKRRGKLWQDRFYSKRLDMPHLYEAIRYVELNPVRSFIVDNPFNYQYSSAKSRVEKQSNQFVSIASIKEYFLIENWKDYLQEKMNETLIQEIEKSDFWGRC